MCVCFVCGVFWVLDMYVWCILGMRNCLQYMCGLHMFENICMNMWLACIWFWKYMYILWLVYIRLRGMYFVALAYKGNRMLMQTFTYHSSVCNHNHNNIHIFSIVCIQSQHIHIFSQSYVNIAHIVNNFSSREYITHTCQTLKTHHKQSIHTCH